MRAIVALFTRAWIEMQIVVIYDNASVVALFTRAWIEIQAEMEALDSVPWSPSLRGRGLKCKCHENFFVPLLSPSLRGRGLKYIRYPLSVAPKGVALFTRAWIEIKSQKVKENRLPVALFTRAWIEIGACLAGEYNVCKSPSLRGRGLK